MKKNWGCKRYDAILKEIEDGGGWIEIEEDNKQQEDVVDITTESLDEQIQVLTQEVELLDKEVEEIDEEYLKMLKYGISLIIKNHPSDATLDDVNYQFDIAFGLSLRKMFADYNHLGDIIEEVALFPQSKTNAEKTRQKCMSMLRECEKSLIHLWNPVLW